MPKYWSNTCTHGISLLQHCPQCPGEPTPEQAELTTLRAQLAETQDALNTTMANALAMKAQLSEREAQVERLRGELARVAPFLAIHGISGYTIVDDTDATPIVQHTHQTGIRHADDATP